MVVKGSLVKYVGKGKKIPAGKFLFVHDVKDDTAIVWWRGSNSTKWGKKSVPLCDVEEVVE